MPMNLERMQKDCGELQAALLRILDAELFAITVCEQHADDADFPPARAALAEASLVAWGAIDEASAVRGVYERAAMRDELEGRVHGDTADLLERWRSAARRALAPFESYVARWRK